MRTLKEFRDLRQNSMSQDAAEVAFTELFSLWLSLDGKLNNMEQSGFSNEARKYRDLVGLTKANEIMDALTQSK